MTTDIDTDLQDQSISSLLVADIGATHTNVALFDEAAGGYRLINRSVTPTTIDEPWLDVMEGVQQSIQRITAVTGRQLIGESGRLIRPTRTSGSGVDHFGALVSAAPPMRTLIVGLFEDVSIASARRLLHTIYAEEVDCFSLADTRSESEQIQAIIKQQPDLFLIVGGTDGGAENRLLDMLDVVDIGIQALAGSKRIQVLYAGNRQLREKVSQKLGDYANVQVADNIRPSLDREDLTDATQLLSELYEDIKVGTLPGVQELRDWCSIPLASPARRFAKQIEYLAHAYDGRIMGVDLGAGSVTLVDATRSQTRTFIQSRLGMGQAIVNVMDIVSPEELANHLPVPMTAEHVENFIRNKAVQPRSIPMVDDELYLEQTIARAMIRHTAREAGMSMQDGRYRLLLARGSTLTQVPRLGQAVLLLLDALTPTGIFAVALDQYGALPALGSLATMAPLAAVQALAGGVLADMGWVIAPTGRAQPGQKVMHVVMESAETARLEIEVAFGSLEVLPLSPGQEASVTVQPEKRFDIGHGPGKGTKLTLRGGDIGLIIDARGRPLRYPTDDQQRQEMLQQWLWDMGG